jgi:hypothetical protein
MTLMRSAHFSYGSFADIEVCIINVCFALKTDILQHGFHVR